MFNNISEILKSFTPAQRITALLILVFTIVLVTLGPSIIDSNTNTCDELKVRLTSQSEQLKAQQAQIIALSGQVKELNGALLQGQTECTANLIQKQQEIMRLVNDMIEETQRKADLAGMQRRTQMVVMPDPGNGAGDEGPRLAASRPESSGPTQDPQETLIRLKRLKGQIQKTMKSN